MLEVQDTMHKVMHTYVCALRLCNTDDRQCIDILTVSTYIDHWQLTLTE